MTALETLQMVRAALAANDRPGACYRVPRLWSKPDRPLPAIDQVNPYSFFRGRIDALLARPRTPLRPARSGRSWSRTARAYNLFVRLAAAWDHDGDGTIALAANAAGWRETGTFLKSIVLLPYIQALGCDTIHLLPVTKIGQVHRKGTLGSPFAVCDHYALDEAQAEPALGLGAALEFKALVEAAHHLGLRVILEIPLRTASKDHVWVAEHPDWFYWIRADIPERPAGSTDTRLYGPPIFSPDLAAIVKAKVNNDDSTDLPVPPLSHRAMFTPPPARETLTLLEDGWIGMLPDGTRVKVASGFADLSPPDAPLWTDISYLKLYDHPDFNYIAYNTIRRYDPRLARPEHRNSALWRELARIIPFYQTTFGIDGIMLDMGHSLPDDLRRTIVAEARAIDPAFACWAEDFDPYEKDRSAWADVLVTPPFVHKLPSLERFIASFQRFGLTTPVIATAETHNTPRLASTSNNPWVSRSMLAIGALLPCVPWIHNGFELAERAPVNPVIYSRSSDELKTLPEDLVLFSAGALDWTGERHLIEWVRVVLGLRQQYEDVLAALTPETFEVAQHGPVWIFTCRSPQGQPKLILIANMDWAQAAAIDLALPCHAPQIMESFTREALPLTSGGRLHMELEPARCVLFEV